MALPKKRGGSKKSSFKDSDVPKYVTSIDHGSEVETNYAADTNSIIFIQDSQSDHFVAFKTFLKSFKLDVKPTIELDRSIFVLDPFISTGQTMFTYSLTLDVPAASPHESKANLAKMEEMFRFVGTLGNRRSPSDGLDATGYDLAFSYHIYFSNLVSRGKTNGAAKYMYEEDLEYTPAESGDSAIASEGISCIIKKINYEPSLDTGFFEDKHNGDTVFLPKHYTLSLEFIVTNDQGAGLGLFWPFGMGVSDV